MLARDTKDDYINEFLNTNEIFFPSRSSWCNIIAINDNNNNNDRFSIQRERNLTIVFDRCPQNCNSCNVSFQSCVIFIFFFLHHDFAKTRAAEIFLELCKLGNFREIPILHNWRPNSLPYANRNLNSEI